MGYFVVACYKPKNGKDIELRNLIKEHLPILRSQNLATARSPYVMRASDGTYIEVFEWTSKQAVEIAHTNPAVQKMWQDFSEVSDYQQLSSLPETKDLFAHFESVDL